MKKVFILFFLALSFILNGQRSVDVRIVDTKINAHSQTLTAEIQIRKTDRVNLFLGGYNMRMYYNSSKLELLENNTSSLLASAKYSAIKIDNHIKDVNVSGHGFIDYAQNVSFLSFYSNLISTSLEGEKVSEQGEWSSIASLEFKILSPFQNEEVITLARQDKTGEIATAFIEMTEWTGPDNIKTLKVNEFIEDVKGFSENNEAFVSIKIGPNPASTDLNIDFSRELEGNNYNVAIRDVAGVLIMNQKIDNGSKKLIMDIRNLSSANYLVEIRNNNEIIETKKIIKIN